MEEPQIVIVINALYILHYTSEQVIIFSKYMLHWGMELLKQ